MYSFATVYCMNFVIFWCVTLKLFFFSFVPLLARNPGDVNGRNSILSVISLTWAWPKNLCIEFCTGVCVDPKPISYDLKHNAGEGTSINCTKCVQSLMYGLLALANGLSTFGILFQKMSVRHTLVRLCYRPSVCLSHGCMDESIRLKLGSWTFHYRVAQSV